MDSHRFVPISQQRGSRTGRQPAIQIPALTVTPVNWVDEALEINAPTGEEGNYALVVPKKTAGVAGQVGSRCGGACIPEELSIWSRGSKRVKVSPTYQVG